MPRPVPCTEWGWQTDDSMKVPVPVYRTLEVISRKSVFALVENSVKIDASATLRNIRVLHFVVVAAHSYFTDTR